jgi:octaprenyl-diphosphate synthase
VGEIEQSTLRYDFELSDEQCESIADAKTATLYAAACELGARYPGGREDIGAELASFGHEIGLAFQIVDDCLDVVGDAAVVGKSVGNDVEDGKITLPVLHAYCRASPAERARVREVYTQPGLERRIEHLRAACDLAGGVESAMVRAAELARRAQGRLADLPASASRDALMDLAEYVLERRW